MLSSANKRRYETRPEPLQRNSRKRHHPTWKYLPIEKELEQTQSLFDKKISTAWSWVKQIHELHFQASNPLLRDKYEKKDKVNRPN